MDASLGSDCGAGRHEDCALGVRWVYRAAGFTPMNPGGCWCWCHAHRAYVSEIAENPAWARVVYGPLAAGPQNMGRGVLLDELLGEE